MYLLDTNVFVDMLRGNLTHAYEMMRKSDAFFFATSAVVRAELLCGASKMEKPEQERFRVESLLLPFACLPFDDACAVQYGRIRAHLERKGEKIGANNYLIAATALAHSMVLVTHNVREFCRVPGLQIEDWVEASI